MPVNTIRYTVVRTFRELEHPQIIAFNIGECGLGRNMSATHLVHGVLERQDYSVHFTKLWKGHLKWKTQNQVSLAEEMPIWIRLLVTLNVQ